MKQIIIALALLAVVGIATYYFVFKSSPGMQPAYTPSTTNTTDTNTPAPTEQLPTPQTTQSPAPGQNTPLAPTVSSASVEIKNFSFNPSTLTVKTNTKITWTNKDGMAHTVTSNSGAFDSGTINPGATYSFVFKTPGTYTYHCNVHPSMTATVVVTP